jgi:predicted RNA-binding Zn-ribbon protein involved in translation (DUF1610 family)
MKQIHTDKPLPWNGGNAPTCPECGSGNAMLTYHGRPKHAHDVQCRDCGLVVLVDPPEPYQGVPDRVALEQELDDIGRRDGNRC